MTDDARPVGKPKFAPLPLAAVSDPRLVERHLKVLAAVAYHDRFNKNGQGCWARLETLATDTGLHHVTVSRAIGELVDWGYLSASRQPTNRRLRAYIVIYKDNSAIVSGAANHQTATATGDPTLSGATKNDDLIVSPPKDEVPEAKGDIGHKISYEALREEIPRKGKRFSETGLHGDVELAASDTYSQLRKRAQRLIGERDALIALLNLDTEQLDALMRREATGDLDDSTFLAELRRC